METKRFTLVVNKLIKLTEVKKSTKKQNIRDNFKWWYNKNWRRVTTFPIGKIAAIFIQEFGETNE